MTPYVQLENVTRRFGSFAAVENVSVSIRGGELLSFVGPSGAGKTTLLRMLAGLDAPTQGRIVRRSEITRDRPAILVFQDYLLFPHMTVFDNVAFGLRSKRRRVRLRRTEIQERVTHYLEQLGIAEKQRAWPGQLSGGQKQRVALARALVMEPGLLLLDEPFANLDKNLKRETARFIRTLQRDVGVTTVMVSHDLEEASEVSDRIAVLIDGRLHQIDAFQRVYFHPSDLPVARLFGPVNVIPSHLLKTVAGLDPHETRNTIVCARSESFDLYPRQNGEGTITDMHLLGGTPHYTVTFPRWEATVRAPREGFKIGSRVALRAHDVFTIEREGSE